MPKTLRKVQRHIKSKKGKASSDALHEKSRDAKRLQSAITRDEKIAKLAASRAKMNSHQLQRVTFFQERIVDRAEEEPLTLDDMHRLIRQFLGRSDAELATLKRERRAGRPPAPKETALEGRRKAEECEYDSGFRLPDLRDADSLESLKKWDGKMVSLNTVNFVRLSRDGSSKIAERP